MRSLLGFLSISLFASFLQTVQSSSLPEASQTDTPPSGKSQAPAVAADASSPTPDGSPTPTAIDIVRKADSKLRGESSGADMVVRVVRPSWERKMRIKSWSLGTEYALILILEPAKEEGTVFLKRQKEMWQWIPRIGRSVKLPPSMMMQSWMGTDFTNDDLIRESSIVEDYTHAIKGDSLIEGRKCWVLELTPKENAPVVWGRLKLWIDQKEYMQLRTEFYDEENELVNVLSAHDVKELGGKQLPAKLVYYPMDEPDHKTVMEYQSLKFDVKLDPNFFSKRNMKKVK